MSDFKPMLADAAKKPSDIRFPCWASPKLDGIRAVVINGVLLSRNLKPIPNKHLQSIFGKKMFDGLDGELIFGDPCRPTAFRDTSSAVMSIEGKPAVVFYVFDTFSWPEDLYVDRAKRLKEKVLNANFQLWPSTEMSEIAQLDDFEGECLKLGFEGVMLRRPDGPYKFGRSTLREGYLLKLKRFEDGEALVLGFEELMHNGNEAKKDELGRTKRSTHKAGKTGLGVLGAFLVRDVKTGVEFSIGSGMTAADREHFWQARASLMGKFVKYRFFPTGSKDKPRFPVFAGFRDKIDL